MYAMTLVAMKNRMRARKMPAIGLCGSSCEYATAQG